MNKKYFRGILLFFIFILIYFGIGILSRNQLVNFTQNINNFFSPFTKIGLFFHDLFFFNDLRGQLFALKEENQKLALKELDCFKTKEENEALKLALNFKEQGIQSIEAKITFLDSSPLPYYFWIDKGENDGLKAGMNVISKDEVLIGQLIKCEQNFCQGEFIFAPNKKINVTILGTLVQGVAERDSSGAFILSYVPEQAEIEPLSLIVSSGDNDFLKGFLVGRIKSKIEKSAVLSGGLTQFEFDPLIDYRNLWNTLVIINPSKDYVLSD